jgi:hypothetical protein
MSSKPLSDRGRDIDAAFREKAPPIEGALSVCFRYTPSVVDDEEGTGWERIGERCCALRVGVERREGTAYAPHTAMRLVDLHPSFARSRRSRNGVSFDLSGVHWALFSGSRHGAPVDTENADTG